MSIHLNYYKITYVQAGYISGRLSAATYIMESQLYLLEFRNAMISNGFTRTDSYNDPEEIIMPAAIISVTPTDSKGWSGWALEQHKRDSK